MYSLCIMVAFLIYSDAYSNPPKSFKTAHFSKSHSSFKSAEAKSCKPAISPNPQHPPNPQNSIDTLNPPSPPNPPNSLNSPNPLNPHDLVFYRPISLDPFSHGLFVFRSLFLSLFFSISLSMNICIYIYIGEREKMTDRD